MPAHALTLLARPFAHRALRVLRGSALAAGLCAASSANALCLFCSGSVSATPHAFGNYAPLSGTANDSSSSVTVTINGAVGLGVGYEIAMSAGQSTVVLDRQMANGADRMSYNLYTNTGRTVVWGDGVTGTTLSDSFFLNVLGTNTRSHTVYGRVPAGQTTLRPGNYADTITVTITF